MPIKFYTVVHSVKGTSTINLRLSDGSTASLTNVSVTEANYILSILRHQRNINWIAAQGLLSTGVLIPVGEDEPAANPIRVATTTVSVRARKAARRN